MALPGGRASSDRRMQAGGGSGRSSTPAEATCRGCSGSGDDGVRRSSSAAAAPSRGEFPCGPDHRPGSRSLRALRARLRALPRLRAAARPRAGERAGPDRNARIPKPCTRRAHGTSARLPACRVPNAAVDALLRRLSAARHARRPPHRVRQLAPRRARASISSSCATVCSPFIVVMPPGSPSTYDRATEWANGPAPTRTGSRISRTI